MEGRESHEQVVGEDVLGCGDEDGPAEGLGEDDEGGAYGDVVEREDGLRCHKGLVHAEAGAEAEEGLVANPFGVL